VLLKVLLQLAPAFWLTAACAGATEAPPLGSYSIEPASVAGAARKTAARRQPNIRRRHLLGWCNGRAARCSVFGDVQRRGDICGPPDIIVRKTICLKR
jgi:hypothetical protein